MHNKRWATGTMALPSTCLHSVLFWASHVVTVWGYVESVCTRAVFNPVTMIVANTFGVDTKVDKVGR